MNHRFTLSDTGNVPVDNVVKYVAHYSSVNFSERVNEMEMRIAVTHLAVVIVQFRAAGVCVGGCVNSSRNGSTMIIVQIIITAFDKI